MRALVSAVAEGGIRHNDLSLRHFLRAGRDILKIIDFTQAEHIQSGDEHDEVDELGPRMRDIERW